MDTTNPYISPADLYLLEQWQDDSPLSDREQLIKIFTAYTQLGKDGQQPYLDTLRTRKAYHASDLTEPERTQLDRIRVPATERHAYPNDGVWLRTCYTPASDAAFAAVRKEYLHLHSALVLDDASLYDFGDDWQRIFSLMPQLLGMESAQEYREAKEEMLAEAKQAVLDDRQIAIETGYDPYEDATALPLLYGWYHWACNTGYIFVVDDVALAASNKGGNDDEDGDSGKVLAVWYDDRGRVVRSTREDWQNAYQHANILMDAFISDHSIWTHAMVGEDYDHYDEEDELEEEEDNDDQLDEEEEEDKGGKK